MKCPSPDLSGELPGFRRRIVITPEPGRVSAALEDDIHAMSVVLRHDGTRILDVEAEIARWPWSTCPGARAALVQAFSGASLDAGGRRLDKKSHCTHLFDLAGWAAAHAHDPAPTTYDLAISDPQDGEITARLWRNGEPALAWRLRGNDLIAPPDLVECTLFTMRDWIADLDPTRREAARILQWACLVAHGRAMPWIIGEPVREGMPANCFTFQPGRIENARRIGERLDFSGKGRAPLDKR